MEYLISLLILLAATLIYLNYKRYLIKNIVKAIPVFLIIGFVWDFIGLSRGWWSYNEASIFFLGIPIEDFMFFILVPAGGINIYDLMKNGLKKSAA